MEAFEAYVTFMALKNHFSNDNYDYFKYNGKVNVKYENFIHRNDRFYYERLSKKNDIKGLLLSSFLECVDGKIWVGDVLQDEFNEKYIQWKKRNESLTYYFKNDINKLDKPFDKNVIVLNGQYPPLLLKYMQNEICIETLIILDILMDIFKYWNKKIDDTIMWPSIYKKCIKYKPFLSINVDKYKKIVIDIMKD